MLQVDSFFSSFKMFFYLLLFWILSNCAVIAALLLGSWPNIFAAHCSTASSLALARFDDCAPNEVCTDASVPSIDVVLA